VNINLLISLARTLSVFLNMNKNSNMQAQNFTKTSIINYIKGAICIFKRPLWAICTHKFRIWRKDARQFPVGEIMESSKCTVLPSLKRNCHTFRCNFIYSYVYL